MSLNQKKCIPCTAGTPPLSLEVTEKLLKELGSGWVIKDGHLEKTYIFKNFKEALHFTNLVGALAEQEGHHPDIYLSWGKVRLEVWTHKIKGLSESDFILAAKCEQLA